MKSKNIIIIFLICCLPLFACRPTRSAEKKQQKVQAQKAKKDAEALVLYQKALKNHQKNQSKSTRKQMKQSLRKSQNKKDFFLKRWFSKKK